MNTPMFNVVPEIKCEIPKSNVPKNKEIFLPNLSAIIPVGISKRKIQTEKQIQTPKQKIYHKLFGIIPFPQHS